MNILEWSVLPNGIRFNVFGTSGNISYDSWGLDSCNTQDGKPARLGILQSFLESEEAKMLDNHYLLIPHGRIASLTPGKLTALGLPSTPPVVLTLPPSKEIITEPEFRFRYALYNHSGRPVSIEHRTGCIAEIGNSKYTLLDPLFSIISIIDDFNTEAAQPLDVKWRLLALIKSLIPDFDYEADVDPYLREMNIAFPNAFTLAPFINDSGEPDFNPVPINREESDIESPFEGDIISEALPPVYCRNFGEYFRKRRKVMKHYPAQDNWYVVLTEPIRRGLEVVHEYQQRPVEVRKAFIRNPRSFLKNEIGDQIVDEILESLFSEEGYSDRVKAIGLWQPKVIPWIKAVKEPWLPPEQLGIRLGDQFVTIPPEDLPEIRDKVRTAIEENVDTIKYGEYELPATQNVLDSLQTLTEKAQPKPTEKGEDRGQKESSVPKEKTVLLIRDQIEDLEYIACTSNQRSFSKSIPEKLRSTLKDHQVAGLNWLQEHLIKGTSGALLADDMGLGKTFTSLAFLLWLRQLMERGQIPSNPILIVAPTGLLKNWSDEHGLHLQSPGLGKPLLAYGKELRCLKIQGAEKGNELTHGIALLDIRAIERNDWVLTTYETLRDYQHSFGKIKWAAAIFDEAQKVKNPSTAMTEAAKAMQIEFCIAMTGTPVENRMADLWCILDMVQPGVLGSLKDFVKEYEATAEHIESANKLNRILLTESSPQLMLRRMKNEELSSLPKIQFHNLEETMPPTQASAYSQAIEMARSSEGRQKGLMLETLHRLRSISLHPFISPEASDEMYIRQSARLHQLFNTLDSVKDKGEKALIFVESCDMQSNLSTIIQKRYSLCSPPLLINGTVSGEKRKLRVDQFQEKQGFDCMILSPKAGGVGLTLTAANHVIHLSRWWNPAVEDQCTDRAYRIGQSKDVNVYYPLAIHPDYRENSFDLKLNALLDRKRQLSQTVLAPTAFSSGDATELFEDTVHGYATGKTGSRESILTTIDLMEPVAFENWVLGQLKSEGYTVQTTPTSHDAGADGIALAPKTSSLPNLILQCKHTQSPSRLIGKGAVEEVLRAANRYGLPDPIKLAVVTNAAGFSRGSRRLAKKKSVMIIDRGSVDSIFQEIREQ